LANKFPNYICINCRHHNHLFVLQVIIIIMKRMKQAGTAVCKHHYSRWRYLVIDRVTWRNTCMGNRCWTYFLHFLSGQNIRNKWAHERSLRIFHMHAFICKCQRH